MLVNPGSPTPKQTPENPNTVSQAYYLRRDNSAEVAFDDCKRTNEPTPTIPDLRKGDMVEVKTLNAATIATIPNVRAQAEYAKQLERQINAVRMEGKGRRVITCVGSERNVVWFTKIYAPKNPEVRFVICNP